MRRLAFLRGALADLVAVIRWFDGTVYSYRNRHLAKLMDGATVKLPFEPLRIEEVEGYTAAEAKHDVSVTRARVDCVLSSISFVVSLSRRAGILAKY